MKFVAPLALTALLLACEKESAAPAEPETAKPAKLEAASEVATKKEIDLQAILDSQPEEHKARYIYRHPAETIDFFGIKPGMTVVEYLPGGGWYSQILAPLLGSEGTLIGVDYNMAIWENFSWMNDEFLAGRVSWPGDWTAKFAGWGGELVAKPVATRLAELDDNLTGSADMALFIRALHNMARFESKGQFLSEALSETYALLKPGGVVGVVQHQAPENMSADWSDGSKGYLKKSDVKKFFEEAGFEFVAESSINENELDQPGEDDFVWRLPPSYASSGDDAEKKAAFTAIGESNRMTLMFKKPAN